MVREGVREAVREGGKRDSCRALFFHGFLRLISRAREIEIDAFHGHFERVCTSHAGN